MRRILLLDLLIFLVISSPGQTHLASPRLELPKEISSNVQLESLGSMSPLFVPKPVNSNVRIWISCCCSSSVMYPLFIVDGIISDSSALKSLNPKDILRIDILKGTKATAIYGYRAEEGAIIISTNRSKYLIVEDEDNHSVIEGATVKVLSGEKKQSSSEFITDQDGRIDLSSFADNEKEYGAEISCVGYKTKTAIITKDKNCIVQLQKDYKKLSEVIVVGFISTLCRTLHCICYSVFKIRDSVNKNEVFPRENFLVYPNPVRAGSSLTIVPGSVDKTPTQIQLIASSGQLILCEQNNTEKISSSTIQIPLNITAGIYFLRCMLKNKQSTTTKVIITK